MGAVILFQTTTKTTGKKCLEAIVIIDICVCLLLCVVTKQIMGFSV